MAAFWATNNELQTWLTAIDNLSPQIEQGWRNLYWQDCRDVVAGCMDRIGASNGLKDLVDGDLLIQMKFLIQLVYDVLPSPSNHFNCDMAETPTS